MLCLAEVLLAYFLRLNVDFGERVGALSSSLVNLQGRVFVGGNQFWRRAALELGSVVVGGRVWRRGRAFRSWCRRRLGALVRQHEVGVAGLVG